MSQLQNGPKLVWYKEVYIEGSRTGLIDSTFQFLLIILSIHAGLMETGQLYRQRQKTPTPELRQT